MRGEYRLLIYTWPKSMAKLKRKNMSKLSHLAVDVKAAICLEGYPQDRLGNLVLRHRAISNLEETDVRLLVHQDVSLASQRRCVDVRFTLTRHLQCNRKKGEHER